MGKMSPGMRMLVMNKVSDGNRRMGNDRGSYMGNYSRMGDEPEMRRRRDSRGRYMGDDNDGPEMAYRPWPEPHIPPYLDQPDMRYERGMTDGPMRDRNIVNIRDYQDRRRIGFGESRMMDDDYERGHTQKHGYADSKHKRMDQQTAERWVSEMEGNDPAVPDGGKWTPDQVKPFAQRYGFPTDGEKFWEFYAIMNAMYSDAYETAKEFNVVKPEFFASLAKGWLNDKDAVPNKAQMYYECIVKK